MCQKSCKIFKQLYSVILTTPCAPPRSLQVFKNKPTREQLIYLISNEVIGKIEPSPHIYSEKPKIDIVQIHIPVDILYR